jgi:uncharacterized protein YegP (UPF0339 family)
MKATFEIFQDRKKQYRFRLKASNGKIICQSEAYTRRENCLNGIESMRRCAPVADVVEV